MFFPELSVEFDVHGLRISKCTLKHRSKRKYHGISMLKQTDSNMDLAE